MAHNTEGAATNPPASPPPVLLFGDRRLLDAPGPNLGRREDDAEQLHREELQATAAAAPRYCFGPVRGLNERRTHHEPVEVDRRVGERRGEG